MALISFWAPAPAACGRDSGSREWKPIIGRRGRGNNKLLGYACLHTGVKEWRLGPLPGWHPVLAPKWWGGGGGLIGKIIGEEAHPVWALGASPGCVAWENSDDAGDALLDMGVVRSA
jgi:hypothetical protein